MAERVMVRDLTNDEGRKLLSIVRRGSGSVVRWRRAQIVLWSAQRMDVPAIAQIAFTSDRSGAPQIWVMDAEGLGVSRLTFNDSYADRATWSPAPFNEIAYSARSGPGFDIRIYDFSSHQSRQLTNGEGSNESPAFAPNGRHLAFTSTRAGKVQIFSIARDGKQLTKLTSVGDNTTPNWSK